MEDSESDFSDISDIFSDSEIPQVKCKAEAKVLKSVDKDAHHPDDWPTFPLEDATVHKTDGSLANLLNVELQGPFVIRGRLRVDTEHEEFLLSKHNRECHIEIKDCFVFSIGFPVAIWAAGRAGWFELSPSRRYAPVYRHMVEAINIYYFATELYEESLSKKRKMPSLEELFYKYALKDGSGLRAAGPPSMTVANRFRVHREFLLSQTSKASMIYSPSRKQKMAWSKTSLHQWLTLQEPVCLPEIVSQPLTVKLPDEDLKTFESEPKAALSRKHQKAPTSSSTFNASTEPPVVLISDTEESDSEGPLQHINVQTGSFSSKKAPSEIQSYPLIWKTQKRDQRPRTTRIIVRCIREEVTLSKRDQWTAGKLATHLYFKYSISAPAMAKIIIRTCAKNILKALDAPWHNSHLYKDLQLASTSTHPITINQDKQLAKVVSQYRLVRRKVKSQNAQAGSKEANSKEASGKEAKNVKTPRPHERIVSPEQSHERSGRGIGSGKIPGRRPPLASKRKLAGISDMTETETSELIEAAAISNTRPPQIQTTVTSLPNRKRRRYSPTRTPPPSDRPRPDLTSWNGEPDISSPSVCSDAEADAANRDPDAPPPPLVKKDKTTLGLVSRPMPSIDAQVTGPHETFRCHQNNCNYHMPNAFLPDVQEEIYAHWRWHADQLDRVTRDIENELSIRKKSGRRDTTQHLLEKIMGIGRGIRERENELIDLGVGVRPATNPVVTGFPDRVRKAGVF